VLIGATAEGRKELVGFTDGARESAQNWRDLLLDLKRRGLDVRPHLAIADGALGFWKAAGEVWPATRELTLVAELDTASFCHNDCGAIMVQITLPTLLSVTVSFNYRTSTANLQNLSSHTVCKNSAHRRKGCTAGVSR
jgi:Transposase, Mutator family